MNMTIFFSRKRFYVIVAVLVIGLILGGCAGSSKKEEQPPKEPVAEQKGTLSRTFTIVDEQGRNAGTLSLDFSGGAVLRDENGNPVFTFQELSKVIDSEKRQTSSCHVEGFRECSCDFLKYLTRKRKIDSALRLNAGIPSKPMQWSRFPPWKCRIFVLTMVGSILFF